VILIRPGQTEFNRVFSVSGRDPGIRDPHLSDLGRQPGLKVPNGACRESTCPDREAGLVFMLKTG
jgi:broad specificity phosphatase PhoE